MRREKGGFVSHVATTCLLSTSPPTLFPNSLMSLVSRSLVTTAITIITADQMQYNRQHFNLCYRSFYVLSFYCFLHCLLFLSSFYLQIVFLSICVSMNILKCFICNSSVSLQKDPFPKLRLFPVAIAYCNHSFLNRRLRRSNHQGPQQRNIWMVKRSIAPKEKRSCAKAGMSLSVKNLTDRFLHVMKVGTIKLSARCFVILIISLLDD